MRRIFGRKFARNQSPGILPSRHVRIRFHVFGKPSQSLRIEAAATPLLWCAEGAGMLRQKEPNLLVVVPLVLLELMSDGADGGDGTGHRGVIVDVLGSGENGRLGWW